MSFKNVLVPYDGSEESENALETAVELVEAGGRLTIFQCFEQVFITSSMIEDPMGTERDSYETAMLLEILESRREKNEEEYKEKLPELLDEKRPDAGIEPVVATSIGNPGYEIAKYAEDNGCDLIVMGRRGLGAVRSMLGSVSQRVAHETRIPLLLVR